MIQTNIKEYLMYLTYQSLKNLNNDKLIKNIIKIASSQINEIDDHYFNNVNLFNNQIKLHKTSNSSKDQAPIHNSILIANLVETIQKIKIKNLHKSLKSHLSKSSISIITKLLENIQMVIQTDEEIESSIPIETRYIQTSIQHLVIYLNHI